MLSEIINDYNIVASQEHWLVHNNLNELFNVNKEFDGVAVSAMNDVDYTSGPGRPLGGTGLLWKKTVFKNIFIYYKNIIKGC